MSKKILNPKLPKPYSQMTFQELDAEVAKLNQEFIADQARPLTPELKARLKRAKRKRGRPRIGKGAIRILVTVEKGLLERTTAYARKHKISRARMIARGLESILAG